MATTVLNFITTSREHGLVSIKKKWLKIPNEESTNSKAYHQYTKWVLPSLLEFQKFPERERDGQNNSG